MLKRILITSTCLSALAVLACNHGQNQVAAASSGSATVTPEPEQSSSGRSLQIRGSSAHRAYACQGDGVDSVQVTGSSNILTITGHCGSLQVTGSSDTITVDSVTTIQFTGNSNSILWRSAKPVTVSDHGQSNSVARATSQAASSDDTVVSSTNNSGSTTATGGTVDATVSSALQAANAASQSAAAVAGSVQGVQTRGNMLNIILSNQKTTQDCGNGRTVNITGYQNDITLTGSCGKIVLNGWGNTIHIEEVAVIEIMGHTNTLTWERGRGVQKPAVQIDSGTDNSVRHITPGSE